MKTLIITFLLFGFLNNFANTVDGRLLNEQKEALIYANVLLFTASDSTMVKVGYSDDQGYFKMSNIPVGSYWLQITYLGMDSFESQIFQLKGAAGKSFGSIFLRPDAETINEVEVVAVRPLLEVLPDKLVFNVGGSINATGNTGLELLRKAPGVMLDNNNNILLGGQSGVRIFVNGKPSPFRGEALVGWLQSLQSSEVDAIEIINNPPAKYDAEGTGGIINIRLKKDKKLGANANLNLGYSIGELPRYNASVNGNYRNKSFNTFANYSFSDDQSTGYYNMFRTQPGGAFDQQTRSTNYSSNHNAKLGTDFFLNDKHTIGWLLESYISDYSGSSRTITSISNARQGAIDSILLARSDRNGRRVSYKLNLNYQYSDEKGSSWNVDLDYGNYNHDRIELQPNRYTDPTLATTLQERNYRSEPFTQIGITTFRIDHERKLGKTQFSLGVKYANVLTDNDFDFFRLWPSEEILDIDRSNQFTYRENVNAAYTSLQRQFGKLGVKAGLRVEQTRSTGELIAIKSIEDDLVDRSFTDFFPSAGLTYSINPKNSLQLSYSRRINRPSYQNLNPFEFKSDELSFSRGNPFLKPEYTTKWQLSHTFNYVFNTSIGFSTTRDLITNITDIEGEKGSFITYLNLAKQKNYSISLSAPFNINQWWSSYTSITAYRMENSADYGEGRIIDIQQNTLSLYAQHNFLLPFDLKFEISGWYSSPSIWGGTFETNALWSLNTGIQKKVFGGRGNLRFSVNDVFMTSNWTATSRLGQLFQDGSGGWDSRQFKLNFSYLLGNDQLKQSRKRNTGLEEEAKRINN